MYSGVTTMPPPRCCAHGEARVALCDVAGQVTCGAGGMKWYAYPKNARPATRPRNRHIDALMLEHPSRIRNKLQRDFLAQHRLQASQQWLDYCNRFRYSHAHHKIPVAVEALDIGDHPYNAFRSRMRNFSKSRTRLAWHGEMGSQCGLGCLWSLSMGYGLPLCNGGIIC